MSLTDVAQFKVPPHSIEAEQAVLGGLMLDNQAWHAVEDKLMAEDFYRREHRLIYHVIRTLLAEDQAVDVLTVAEALKNRDEIDSIGGEVYLFELANNIPSAANIASYATIVRERSVMRRLITLSNEIATQAYHPEGKPLTELLDEAERKVFSIAEQSARGQGPQSIKNLLANAVERIDTLYHANESITGIPTGYDDFDEMTSGLQESDLVIIAGRPSMGKTALALNMAEHAAVRENKPVLVFSMEMSGSSLAMRLLSSIGRIDQHRVRTGKLTDSDWQHLTDALGKLSEAKLYIDDTPALTPSEVRARARRLAKESGGLGLIVVDYLQLMQVPGANENRTLEISEISRSLKALAKELNVPVIALSQLNRGLEQRADKRPVMSDLRESGAIEQDADLIVFIYRDEVYHEDSPDRGIAEIIIAKQRNGPIGKVKLTFLGQYTRFENFAPQAVASEYV
ncbi:MAG: replicative DNA helicase [Gammaproteobacteria bacterium]